MECTFRCLLFFSLKELLYGSFVNKPKSKTTNHLASVKMLTNKVKDLRAAVKFDLYLLVLIVLVSQRVNIIDMSDYLIVNTVYIYHVKKFKLLLTSLDALSCSAH